MIRIGKTIKRWIGIAVFLVMAALIYRHSPFQLEFLGNYDRIWAHRVNTTQKLNWSKPFFKGVELDLVFTGQGILDVTHPPKPGIGLSLKEYLNKINETDDLQFWLDIKNLNADNAAAIYARLEDLLKDSKVSRKDFLIETRYPKGLIPFYEAGYRCSYYLPQRLFNAPQSKQDSVIQIARDLIANKNAMGLSTHFSDYDWLAEYFPQTPKYLWFTGHSRFGDYSKIKQIFRDTTVKVGLIRYNALRGNR